MRRAFFFDFTIHPEVQMYTPEEVEAANALMQMLKDAAESSEVARDDGARWGYADDDDDDDDEEYEDARRRAEARRRGSDDDDEARRKRLITEGEY